MNKLKGIDIVIGVLLLIMGVLLVFISVEVYKLNNNPRYNIEIEEVEPIDDNF
jgi:hypothetical protein